MSMRPDMRAELTVLHVPTIHPNNLKWCETVPSRRQRNYVISKTASDIFALPHKILLNQFLRFALKIRGEGKADDLAL
jgi:hypothetical protein